MLTRADVDVTEVTLADRILGGLAEIAANMAVTALLEFILTVQEAPDDESHPFHPFTV
jgi:hypothetical protein